MTGTPFQPHDIRHHLSVLPEMSENNLRNFIRGRRREYVVLYHGTTRERAERIIVEGLKPTTSTRRNSYQSASGYCYLTPDHEMAKAYAMHGAPMAPDHTVLRIIARFNRLQPDGDNIANKQREAGIVIASNAISSIAHCHSVRVRGRIGPESISIFYHVSDGYKTVWEG